MQGGARMLPAHLVLGCRSAARKHSAMISPRSCRRLGWAGVCVSSIVLASCASSTTPPSSSGTQARATATPSAVTIPTIQTIALNGYMAAYVWPTAHGFIFTGNPGTTAQQPGATGASALYYYDDATQTVRTVAIASAAADGTPRGIQDIVTSGDWVIYLMADSDRSHWVLSALNIASGQRWPVGSAPDSSPIDFNGTVVTDGTHVVWSTLQGQPSASQYVMVALDLASGQSHTLMTSTAANATSIVPVAMASGTFVFVRTTDTAAANGGLNTATANGIWLWKLGDSVPQQIATSSGRSYAVNDRYIAWDDVQSEDVNIYDRSASKETGTVANCIRPQLAQTGPYLVCVDFNASSYRLARLPSGESATFFDHNAVNQYVNVAGDRACWVAVSGSSPYGSAVQCFDMPAS
jgi:hypothetical protein